MYCANCGSKIEKNSLFCPGCGQAIEINASTVNSSKKGKRIIWKFMRPIVILLIILLAYFFYYEPKYMSERLEESFIKVMRNADVDYEIISRDYNRSDKELDLVIASDYAKYKVKVEPLGKKRVEYRVKQTKIYDNSKARDEWKRIKAEMDDD